MIFIEEIKNDFELIYYSSFHNNDEKKRNTLNIKDVECIYQSKI